MKILSNLAIFRNASLFSFTIGISYSAFSQVKTEIKLSKFLFSVETINDGLKLTGIEGCAWKELAFTLKTGASQSVDQYGMTSLKRDEIKEDKSIADFLINIKRTKEGISLEGKEGTSWLNLSYNCVKESRLQYIDNNGMVQKD